MYSWLVSCTQPLPPDTSYLEGKPCAAPCWQGITPGITDEATALKIISDPTLVEQDSIRGGINSIDPSRSGYIYRRVSGGSGGIGLKDGIVYRIGIRPGNDLTLGEVINAFGIPDFVHVEDSSQERYCYAVDLYYLEKGIWVNTGVCEEPNSTYKLLERTAWVDPDIEVGGLTFFEPGPDLRSVLIDSLLFTSDNAEAIIAYAFPWEDFDFYPLAP
ncbi:MAG: hypothetical protein ACE5E7_16020 [Anaerolineae bacterium]